MTERILNLHELNRATLARQYLLERISLSPLETIKHLVALQGQVSKAPYVGLWTRLNSFQRVELTQLVESREVVRASSLRITLHILAADDYLLFQPVLQPILSRTLHSFARSTPNFDMQYVIAELRAFLREQPRTAVELRARMEELYAGMGRPQINDAVRMYLALIQVPPAGTWSFSGRPAHTEATEWLKRPLAAPEAGLPPLILRYLAAFGPASVKDIQMWSKITGVQQVVEELRPELLAFRDEQGRELFDLPNAPRPSEDTPAPVRFLPEYDNIVLGYADRSRILAESDRVAVLTGNGMRPTILIDGFVAGTWKIERTPGRARLLIEAFKPLSPAIQNELTEEGERLLRWSSDDEAEAFDVQLEPIS